MSFSQRSMPPSPSSQAVMILDALAPLPPILGIGHPGQDRRILDRDHRLIIIAVERPGLHLFIGALTAVQAALKPMQVMVALGTDLAQPGLELAVAQLGSGVLTAYTSIPSKPTSHPARSTLTRSVESSIRTGFVLLIWT